MPADGTLSFEHYARSAQAAERGKCDLIFFADGIGIRERDIPRGSLARTGYEIVEMEPMTLLPALAVVTKHIGLVTTASTTYNEPYNLARKFATLDWISNGRAGWNVVTSWSEAEAKNFNREEQLDYDTPLRPRRRVRRGGDAACGTVGRTTRFVFDKAVAAVLRRSEAARARTTRASTSRCAGRSTSAGRRRAIRSSCRPARPSRAASSPPRRPISSTRSTSTKAAARRSTPTSRGGMAQVRPRPPTT